ERAVGWIRAVWPDADLTLLHCTSNYPAAPQDINLRAMDALAGLGVPVGYSDHSLGPAVSIPAAGRAATAPGKQTTAQPGGGGPAVFGLVQRTLRGIAASPALDLELVVTGMHLSDRFGRTERDIEASGLSVARRIEVPIDEDSGRAMGVAVGLVTAGMADYFAERPRDGRIALR